MESLKSGIASYDISISCRSNSISRRDYEKCGGRGYGSKKRRICIIEVVNVLIKEVVGVVVAFGVIMKEVLRKGCGGHEEGK